ncbi:uncharacterized protein LOC113226893 [Hyposmocoma kahamanoa]|uniref:uncharacterized protein LOC113226893 n=1 Tax=Hyposmocoma kahamanoa TaxID=1477025 RepID=UPI000E6D9251|nr:uncharacterized protein LOC113226893 [Hyposmocoma kahamanoa]
MAWKQISTALVTLTWLLASVNPEPGFINAESLKNIANVTYAGEKSVPPGLASKFSPRMDFEQWKPLTGRGDPLRNDPTYDYEPPVLERVHYWADDTRLEREHYPERKSEILMLGVSSRKPSVGSRPQPPPSPPRRHHRPPPPRYEDYSYKLSDHYHMTILVPPPLPPPGHKPSLYILEDNLPPQPISHIKITDPPKLVKPTTVAPEHFTKSYSLQEANLIYQSSTTSQSWIYNSNQTNALPNRAVSSDYAGWGPTTPLDDTEIINDAHNLISNDAYSFYKPMLSEAPPPPRVTKNPLLLPIFIPTALPPLQAPSTTTSITQQTWPTEPTTTTSPTFTVDYNEQTTTDKDFTTMMFQSNTVANSQTKPGETVLDMLTPMMTMPMVESERFEDSLYAHASENYHVFKENKPEDIAQLETMQTMLPPPLVKQRENTTPPKELFHVNPQKHTFAHKKPSMHTHDPYLHMRHTTPMPTIASSVDSGENTKSTTEVPTVSTYLIIQGHSKVKTYSSKIKSDNNDTINNEIPKPNETNEVKHLHPIKEKYLQKPDKSDRIRRSKAQNLKSLIDDGRGSIEIQETDIGIKYDISDGSDVPVEIYRKGIVDNDEFNYSKNKGKNEKRTKRQASLSDLLPDEDTVEEFVYNFLKRKRNETGFTGLIAKVVTGKEGAVLDELDDDENDEDDEDEDDNEYR